MHKSRLTSWIVAFVLLAAACMFSSQIPQFHNYAAFLWFFALLMLITATTLAAIQNRRYRRPR
jgi:membrane protein YdbS with pleckstrin-like domain